MKYIIRIARQNDETSKPFYQDFEYDGEESDSVAKVLRILNERTPLTDVNGVQAQPIEWQCGCMIRKCGACAMRIDGVPRLACSFFLREKKHEYIILEPLSKFPVVKDLVTKKDEAFKSMMDMKLWIEGEALHKKNSFKERFDSASCIMCGCCLEICPNYIYGDKFYGAAAAVNTFRIIDSQEKSQHFKELRRKYSRHYYEGCGKSLSCHDICPVGIPVEELIVRSTALAIWKRNI